MLFIDEIAIIFFISKFCLNRLKDLITVPTIIAIIISCRVSLTCIFNTNITGRIFCHVITTIIDLCFISNLEINFMYHPCSGHIPTFLKMAMITTMLIIVFPFEL